MVMLNSLFETNFVDYSVETALAPLAALLLGLIISLVYIYTHKKEGCSGSFAVTLIILPAILAMMLSLAGGSGDMTAAAFVLAAAAGCTRFFGAAGCSKDLPYIFLSLGAGFACGKGYIVYAAVFAVMMCVVTAALYLVKYPFIGEENQQLKITIPENVDYEGLFDDLISAHTDSCAFRRIRTVEFGSLFEVCYEIKLKPNVSHKEFLDKIRCRNNNLSVSLSVRETPDTTL